MSGLGLGWRYLRSSLGWWFGLVWGLIGTGALVGLSFVLDADRRFREEGVAAMATVVRTGHTPNVRAETGYFIRYRYRDTTGQDHVAEQPIGESTWRQYPAGAELPIVYLPDQPGQSQALPDQQPAWVLPAIFIGIGLVFAGPGWYLAIRSFRQVRRRLRVLRQGVAVLGQVTSLQEQTNVTINNRHPWCLAYQFQDIEGQTHEGISPLLPQKLEARWAVGDPILVSHDAANPRCHEVDIYGVRADELDELTGQVKKR